MITETSAVSFRQNLGEMINQVQFRRDSIVINKDGKPVAAITTRFTPASRAAMARAARRSAYVEPPYPPSVPSPAMTRWQGIRIGSGLRPIAPPTACAAPGRPIRRASSP